VGACGAVRESDPGSVDAAIEETRSFAASGNAPPELAGAKMLMLVDRQSGGRLMLTTFDTEEAMRKADAAMNGPAPQRRPALIGRVLRGSRQDSALASRRPALTAVQAGRLTVGSRLLPRRNTGESASMRVSAPARPLLSSI